jgi:DNA adenine methylase
MPLLKKNKDLNKAETGWVGFNCSFSGKWWGSFSKDKISSNIVRYYQKECFRNMMNQIPNIKNVIFRYSSYLDLEIPDNSIIYCDTPYEEITKYQYKYKVKINHIEFWDWCRNMTKKGHKVFISEYNAPEDFEVLWSKEISRGMTVQRIEKKKVIEKLFKWKEF